MPSACWYLFSFMMLFWQNESSPDNKKWKNKPSSDNVHEMIVRPGTDSLFEPMEPDSAILSIKELLKSEYLLSGRYEKNKADTANEKHILNVAWVDAGFNKISNIGHGEMISLVLLTQGYIIGDTVRVTIAAEDEKTLMPGVRCRAITFIGITNHEDLAILQDVFSIEGEDEQMVVNPVWHNRYICE